VSRYVVLLDDNAVKALRSLDKPVRERVAKAIDALEGDPRPAGCEMLKGSHGYYRVRVGAYRIVYTVNDGELVVLVVDVNHRSRIYGR
jgi:mRNA interferase RelE/StbE